MAKQLNVNLAFTADTSQAKAQLQSLQTQLSGLLNSTNGQSFGNQITGDINKASKAIAELKLHLQNATNVNTGNLDFTKLNESLNKSGTTLQQYGDKLRSLGPAGQQAFNTLASSIAQSEIPIRRSNAALTEMWTTLKNTARWQISSSILHGFMGSISAAVGYAKDLNKSLNDIRIVTGASVDQMAQFAEQANRSAKALSASTTEYTKASLIYYQQGLDDQAVKERTDVTIKMANVSGQTAETVSDQMTAVWNNFAKGSEDLERFADVMVRLGADTASSSDEIAQGLEKFAAIGDMVGLSFNNAAAALATVTATTRQSADVVGTAFKTIFARIQGLKLGETLEDGTDLNKYSEALATVGISIKEQNGELKDMDNILAEMGAKWKTLSKDQQVALAQTVAGLRQYNQLVALMENFDFYEQNLQSAENAEGSLQEQADIYAESWQAASDRVKAATQGIYEDLLNDEAFIDVLNIIEKILTYVDNLIDGLGGLGGVLITVGALLTRAFSAQIAQGITSMTNGIKMMTAAGREQAQQQKAQFMKDSADAIRGMSDGSNEGNMRAAMMEEQLRLQTSMIENSERMSAEEQQVNQILLDRQRILSDNAIAAAKELDAATEAKSDATMEARTDIASARINRDDSVTTANQAKSIKQLNAEFTALQTKMKSTVKIRADFKELSKIPEEGRKSSEILNIIKEKAKELNNVRLNGVISALKEADLEGENFEVTMAKLDATMERVNAPNILNMADMGIRPETIEQLVGSMEREVAANEKVERATNEANAARDRTQASINGATGAQKTWADQMVAGANVVMSIMSALQALSGIIDVATNPDMSGWEKFLSIGSSLAMVFVILAPLFQKNNLELLNSGAASLAAAMGMKAETVAALEAAAATGTFTTALFTLLWPILAVVGAIALLVSGLKLANSIYNADAKAAEKAGEAAEKAAKQFEEAQNKYNEFKDTISNHDEAIEGLAKLTKGTIEYKEQIMKANEEALKLINSQDLLYGTDYKYNDEGLIEFTPGRLEQARKQEFNNLERLEANKSFTAQRAKTAEEKANLTEFARNNLNDDGGIQSEDWGSLIKGASWAASGAAIGATLGTVVPVIGNAVGAIGGAIIGGIAGLGAGLIDVFTDDIRGDSSDNEIESMRKLAEAYDKRGDAALTPDSIKEILGENNAILDDVFAKPTAEMTKALIEEQDPDAKFDMKELNDLFAEKGEDITPEDLKEYFKNEGINVSDDSINQMFESVIDPEVKSQIASLAANTAAIRAHIERTAGSANQDNEAYQRLSEEDQSIADKIIANRVDDALADKDSEAYAQLEKDAVTAWQEEAGSEKGFFKGDESLTYDKYMEITYGKDWKDNYKVENMAGTNATVYKKNEDGKWENIDPDDKKNTLSNDEVKEALVEYYAKQYNDADAAKLAEVNAAAAEVRANVGGIGTVSNQDIKSAFASGETADLSFMTKEQVDELKAELENGTIKVTDEYKKLLLDGANAWSEAAHEARKEAEANSVISEGASKYGLDEKVLKAQADMLQQTHKGLENNAVAAAEMAVANQRLNKGVNKLTDNWKDWNKTLRSSDKTTQDYAEAVVGAQDAIKDMFGLTEDAVIPEDFLQDTENLDLLDQVANGSEEAAQKLHFNLTKAQIEAETFSSDIAQNMINAFDFGDDVDLETTFNEMKTQALNALTEIQGMANGVDIGAGLKDRTKQAQMAAKLNEYAMAAGWTAEQMQSALASVGVRAKITMIEGNPVTKKIPITRVSRQRIKNNIITGEQEWLESSQVEGYKNVTEPTLVPQIDMENPNNPGGQVTPVFEKVNMGNIAPSVTSGGKNSGGGGGDGKPKVVQKKAPIKAKKEKDEIERYHEITKAIEDQERLLDRLSKAKDKAYGENKLKAIDKEIAALQKLNELDSQHLKQIRQRLQLDKKAAESYGIAFDADERINNYDEIIKEKMNSWLKEQEDIQKREIEYEESKNADENYDADGAIKLQIEQDKEKSDEYYEEFKEAIEQYEETYSLFEDTVDKMQEQFDQMAEKTIEKITYGVEFKVEFEEAAIDLLDFQIKLLSKDFEGFSEIAMLTMTKVSHLNEILQAEGNEGIGALYEAYYQGTISLDQFAQTVQDSIPEILSAMEELMSVDEEMMEYYSQTFDAAEEKFTEYLDFIDGGTAKLDHLRNMLSLIGKEQNYDMLGVVLESQYTSASHKLQASSDWYEITKKEYDALYNRWITEKDLLGPKELEMLEDKLKVARTKMQEADEQRLSDLEVIGEKAQEILQNNLDKARKKLEEALVGSSLEDYMTELDRLSKKQEEYLTATNKMYETNKLIRQAQMEMNKTDNNRAKQQYNDYVKYIEQLQESGKLSSYELSVAQAKYELLQAQIALEEAKDAKDQVRLTRDSEGNYGYVYTANEDKVSEAEQAVADAENKLYNIGLEGAQDYQSKKAEILQEAIDTFASIEEQYQTGQIETEAEFNAKMEEAKQYYYDRLKEYDNLYYMALGVMQEESYGNTVDYELDSRNIFNTFANTVDDYLGDVEQSFTDYNSKVEVVKQEVGDDLGAISQKTEEVTKKTEELAIEAEKLTGQIDNELLSVREATSMWGSYRDELYKNIEANKTLIDQLKTIQQLASGEIEDYSSFISEQVANGKGYDDQLVQTALAKRWLKMEGEDDYDYSQMKNDYVQEYADANELSFEEAETALKNDAWYKTLGMLRQYKIERTDWTAIKKEILDKNPEADVSWIDSIIAEKLNYDWSAKIKKYIEDNPGLKYSDEYLQEMLTIRKIKIDSLEDPKSVISNDELLAPYIEKGKLIDDRKNVSSAVSAATGGYTGEWGPEGKIAILHEKELILNAQDTQNFLSAVEILREINGILDQNALVASLGAINMQALSLNSLADQMLQQEVTIHADFPNVTDHNEIELAIDNLINAASQHAYRT